MIKIHDSLLNQVSEQAKNNERHRMNYNFHPRMEDPIQRMLNALEPETYLPPHRHSNPDKDEIFMVLRGKVLLIEFAKDGDIADSMIIEPAKGSYGAEIGPGIWHTLISLERGSVIYEIKQGPFSPIDSNNFAPWAPKSFEHEKAQEYMRNLKNKLL